MSATKPPETEPWVKYVKEAEKSGRLDNKAFWREVGTEYIKRYPEEAYRDMNTQIHGLLRDNKMIDRRKVETVLDVGCGFGRMTNIIITSRLFPNVKRIVAVDISEGMLKEARRTIFTKAQNKIVRLVCADFEEYDFDTFLNRVGLPAFYDLVISSEVMTSIPKVEEDRVRQFIAKMCWLSKKYVVNVDWYWDKERGERKPQAPVFVINNYHWYNDHYAANEYVTKFDRWKFKGYGEYLFIASLR